MGTRSSELPDALMELFLLTLAVGTGAVIGACGGIALNADLNLGENGKALSMVVTTVGGAYLGLQAAKKVL